MTSTDNANERLERTKRLIADLFKLAGDNPSQEEAASALAKAADLMAKYNIDKWEIDHLKPEGQRSADDVVQMDWLWEPPAVFEKLTIANIITLNNMGKHVRQDDERQSNIFAQRDNAIIILRMCVWVIGQLEKSAEADWKMYRGMGKNRVKYMRDYFTGAGEIISARLKEAKAAREQTEAGTAMVLYNAKAVSAKVAEVFPRLSNVKSRPRAMGEGYHDGKRAGENVRFTSDNQLTGRSRALGSGK